MFTLPNPPAMFPALLLSLLFLLPAWFLWRGGRRGWAVIPLIICGLLLGLTCAIRLADANRTQAAYDTEALLSELVGEDLFVLNDLSDADESLFLAAVGSKALYAAAGTDTTTRERIEAALRGLAEVVTDRQRFPAWNRNRNWDREVFFLAHTGAVLAHYQLVTGDAATYADDLGTVGRHLGKRLRRGRYKHLISRPTEAFFRPADNAAALYTLALYDRLTGGDDLRVAYDDWTNYLHDELYHAESRLPCAAFSPTDRCQLDPSAVSTGLYIAYRAAAAPERVGNAIPWREWLHYFRRPNFSPFTVSIRTDMREGEPTRFCDQGAAPLVCDRFERAVGMWAAAEYGGEYTYFRLFSTVVFRRWFGEPVDYNALSPARRTPALTRLALRTVAEWRSGR